MEKNRLIEKRGELREKDRKSLDSSRNSNQFINTFLILIIMGGIIGFSILNNGESAEKEASSVTLPQGDESEIENQINIPGLNNGINIPAPTIKIESPQNISYDTSTPPIDFIVAGSNMDKVLLSIDGGENVSIPHDGTLAMVKLDGLIAAWKFDEKANNTAHDSSGNENSGKIYGAKLIDGKFGSALSFDGVDDYIDCGNIDTSWDAITVLAWIKTTDENSNNGVVAKDESGQTRIWRIKIINGKQNNAVKTTSGEIGAASKSNIEDGKWHLIGLQYDGSKIQTIYDGNFKGSSNQTGTIVSGNDKITIGRNYDNTGSFKGQIDGVMIFNRALSESEISILYNSNFSYLEDGPHNITIFANNTAGSSMSASINFVIDLLEEDPLKVNIFGIKETQKKEKYEVTIERFSIRKDILKVRPNKYDAWSQSAIKVKIKNIDSTDMNFKLNPTPVMIDDLGNQYEMVTLRTIDEIKKTRIYPDVIRDGEMYFEPVYIGAKEVVLILTIDGEEFRFNFNPFE